MLAHFKKNINQTRWESFVTILTLLLFLFKSTIPFFKFPFILFYFGLIIYSLSIYNKRLVSVLIDFARTYFLLLILVLIIVLSVLLSNKLYLVIIKDTLNSIILLSVFYLISLFITTRDDLNTFIKNLINLIIFFAVIISINEFCSLLNIYIEKRDSVIISNYEVLADSYFELDNNFGILPVIFGMISLVYLLFKTDSLSKKIMFNFLLLFFAVAIFFSGSRRGVLILFSIIVLLTVIQLLSILSKNKYFKSAGSKFLSFFITLILFFSIIFFSSYSFKNKTIELLGSKNLALTKQNITFILFKYNSTINKKNTYLDIYNKIWNVVPADPESGWGTRKHKTVFPLSGKNVEIVPDGAKGYYLDSTSNANTWNGNAYSNTLIGNKNVVENDIIVTSVYCYVSEEFNGEWAALSTEGPTHGNVVHFYDLKNKSTWQKLEVSANCTKGNALVYLYFAKYGVKDFSSLKGFVIFACPEVEVISEKDTIASYSVIYENTIMKDILKKNKKVLETDFRYPLQVTQICRTGNTGLSNFLFHTKDTMNDKKDLFVKMNSTADYSRAGILGFSFPLFTAMFLIDDTPRFRKWSLDFISEDTTYYGYKNSLLIDTITYEFKGSRVMRWQFARVIFTKEYNWRQKIFGGGFNHINWYGYYFLKDKTKSDWPHNPFLSVLLYSGILGLMLYLFLLYKVFYYYIRYIKEYLLFFIFFLITFFFAFFSGGSPFDPPLMGFFVILPFFIHSVHKKDAGSNGKPHSKNE